MFTGLPHKLLEPTQFVSAVGDLRKRFVDPKNADFILHTEHFQKDIPADGLAPYASRIWVCERFFFFFTMKIFPQHRNIFFNANLSHKILPPLGNIFLM